MAGAVPVASGLPMMASLVVLVCLCASLTASHEWPEERPQAVAALEESPGRDLSPLQEFTRSNYKDFSYPNEFFEEDRQRFWAFEYK